MSTVFYKVIASVALVARGPILQVIASVALVEHCPPYSTGDS